MVKNLTIFLEILFKSRTKFNKYEYCFFFDFSNHYHQNNKLVFAFIRI